MEDAASAAPISCVVCDGKEWRVLFAKSDYSFVRCLVCGLQQLAPIPSEERIREHYASRQAGGNYDFSLHTDRRDDVTSRMFTYLASFFEGAPSGKRLMDVGCFTGDFLDVAAAAGLETHGMELQSEAARIAAEKHEGRVHNTMVGGFHAFEPASFDCVTALGLIEHMACPQELMHFAAEILKPGGIFMLQTPNTQSLPAKLMGRYWFCYAPVEHIHYFSKSNLIRFLEENGFRLLHVKSHWKTLEFGFAYHQLQFFGKELHAVLSRIEPFVPRFFMNRRFPLYGGEMLVVAAKR